MDTALNNLQSLKRPWLQDLIAFFEAFQKSRRVERVTAEDWALYSTSRWPRHCPIEPLKIDALLLIAPNDVFGLWDHGQLHIINLEKPKAASATFDLDVETIDQAWDSACHRFYHTMPRESDDGALELRQEWMAMVRGCVCYLVGV